MVENKDDYRPLVDSSDSSYETPALEDSEVVLYDEAIPVVTPVVVIPSAPSEESVLVGMSEGTTPVLRSRAPATPLTDHEAEAAAAQAREQGVDLIRSHLSEYLQQNPEANYVTWIATLHPENADVTIDPRFLIPGNPWATVFEEARAILVPEDYNSEDEETKNDDHASYPTRARHLYLGGLIPMIVGFSILLGAIGSALGIQVASIIVYLLAVFFNCICKALPRLSIWTFILYLLPGGLLVLFQALDLLLLVMDTVLVELLALLAYGICTPLAFSHAVGVFYHQQIRRIPHFIRWACRKPFQCDPPRATFPDLCRYRREQQVEVTVVRVVYDEGSSGGVP